MRRMPVWQTALAGFSVFGAVVSAATGVTLLFPGGWLEPMWRLKPEAHEQMLAMGGWAIAMMATVSLACALTAAGLFADRWWGHRLAVCVLAGNLLGDTLNALLRHDLRTLIGLPIAGAAIAWLLTPGVRRRFRRPGKHPDG
jgi:hypothetical protein